LEHVINSAEEKLKDFNDETTAGVVDDFTAEKGQKVFGWWKLSTKYASGGDLVLLFVSIIGSVMIGIGTPLISFGWGANINNVSESGVQKGEDLNYSSAYLMLMIGSIIGFG
jgi:hypothetical protein